MWYLMQHDHISNIDVNWISNSYTMVCQPELLDNPWLPTAGKNKIICTVLPAKSDSDFIFLFTKLSGTYNRYITCYTQVICGAV